MSEEASGISRAELLARFAAIVDCVETYLAAAYKTLAAVTPPSGQVLPEEQAGEFSLLGRLNALTGIEYPDDTALRARIKSYELAFGMQSAVPEVLDFQGDTVETQCGQRVERVSLRHE